MSTDFIIKALDDKYFSQYLQMNEEQLARVNGCWLTADESPGYPCRVTLQEAEVGEKILLIHYPYLCMLNRLIAQQDLFSFGRIKQWLNWRLTKFLKYCRRDYYR